MKIKKRTKIILVIILGLFLLGLIFYCLPLFFSKNFEYNSQIKNTEVEDLKKIEKKETITETDPPVLIPVTHIETPDVVKAIYMSSWAASSKKFKNRLSKMIDDTELNAIIIDIKDSTGKISFDIQNEEIKKFGSVEKRISNIRELTNFFHEKNIYIIGRISVFQDPYLTELKPEWAITKKSDGSVWKDRKGLSFIDPTKKEFHKYILDLALASYEEGFDEINFDYIRYPSDGDMEDIDYGLAEGETRSDNMEKFFKYISTEIKKDKNIPISADVFGLTTEAIGDMGIGQIWEKVLPYFDFIAPMVYPSHYASGYSGYDDPNKYPYEVILRSISGAINKTKAAGEDINKIRPWLQDFDVGSVYTKEMVRAQIKAVEDLGLSSWMLWDPKNQYTPEALLLENN